MNKQEALTDFVNGLHMALNNAAYFRGHPYLIKSIQEFKKKIDALFAHLDPIKILVIPHALVIGERTWEKRDFYIQLADALHHRKIKSIEFKSGVTVEELTAFLSVISLPPKEILKKGGIQNLLDNQRCQHIAAEELDYSQFLQGAGEEIKDIWVYLLKEVVRKKDSQKLNELADNFGSVIDKCSDKDFFEDEQVQGNINEFLAYLKANQKEKFDTCTNDLIRSLFKFKNMLGEINFDKIKTLFNGLGEEDFARLLWGAILTDESFDVMSFKLFYQLIDEKMHPGIAARLLEKARSAGHLPAPLSAQKNIQRLLSASQDEFMPDVYRHSLSVLFKSISFEEKLTFDRIHLANNYMRVLLNFLDTEKEKEKLKLITKCIIKAWDVLPQRENSESIRYLLGILKRRRKEGPEYADLLKELDKHVSDFVETLLWGEPSVDLDYFVDALDSTRVDAGTYLTKIFEELKVGPASLKLFFRFFPTQMDLFYNNLERSRSNIDFLIAIIGALKKLNSYLALEILKRIYSFANELIKVEVVRAMGGFSDIDDKFLFSILEKGGPLTKKEALLVLARKQETKKAALETLLDIPSSLGFKNNLILENMSAVEEARLTEAHDYLVVLSKRHFFWNRSVREKAQEILTKWQ